MPLALCGAAAGWLVNNVHTSAEDALPPSFLPSLHLWRAQANGLGPVPSSLLASSASIGASPRGRRSTIILKQQEERARVR